MSYKLQVTSMCVKLVKVRFRRLTGSHRPEVALLLDAEALVFHNKLNFYCLSMGRRKIIQTDHSLVGLLHCRTFSLGFNNLKMPYCKSLVFKLQNALKTNRLKSYL